MPNMTDVELLDKVKAKSKFNSDAKLAKRLGEAPQNISQVRLGIRNLSTLSKIKCYDILEFNWAKEALLNLFGISADKSTDQK